MDGPGAIDPGDPSALNDCPLTASAGVLGGEVLFNGHPRDGAFWRESAYVKQDDVHIPVLTVQVRAG